MYEPVIDFSKVKFIPPSDIYIFIPGLDLNSVIKTKNFDVNIYPINTYAYSIDGEIWFKSIQSGHYIIALFWEEIDKSEVPTNYLNFVRKNHG